MIQEIAKGGKGEEEIGKRRGKRYTIQEIAKG